MSARSMVPTLRWRLLAVVAVALIVVGIVSVWGLRILTDRIAERQVLIAAQAVATWGSDGDGGSVIHPARLEAVDPAATVVALVDERGAVVASASRTDVALDELATKLADLGHGTVVRVDIGGRPMVFTRVDLPDGTVYGDGSEIAVSAAFVGLVTEGADRLVTALAIAELAVLGVVLVLVALVVTLVVSRTTRSLTALADGVERDDLAGLADGAAAEFTETHEIAAALSRLDERRARTEQELRDFVADASHELRTPLTKIQGWSELHFHHPDPDRADRAFESIVEESQRMRALVDQLAQLARAESVTTSLDEVVELGAVCREVAEDVELIAPDAGVSWSTPGGPVEVAGDARSLTQLVRNLVGNALVHAGEHAHIAVSLERLGAEAVLVVADDGLGMPPELRERAFERFVTRDRRSGTGLGLPIVQAIAAAHGGTVALTSCEGEGTRVEVRLPLHAA